MNNDLKSKEISALSISLLETSKEAINSWKDIKKLQSKNLFLGNNFLKIWFPLFVIVISVILSMLSYANKENACLQLITFGLLILLAIYPLIYMVITTVVAMYEMKKQQA